MPPNPTTRCWRMVLEMQTVCKPKPWQQLLLQLKTLLAFCFHWHSLATTFFTGPIISIQINYRLQYRGKELKRRQYWVQTELKLRSVHLNYICFFVVIVLVVFLKMYTVFSHRYYQTPKKCRCMQICRVCQPLYVSTIDL